MSSVPALTQITTLLRLQNIRHVRLYDADPAMLAALSNTGIRVIVSVPNEQLLAIGNSNATAGNWVARNVAAHFPSVNITAIAVGSEVLSAQPNAAPLLMPPMRYLQNAAAGGAALDRYIKISTPRFVVHHPRLLPAVAGFLQPVAGQRAGADAQVPAVHGSPLMLNVYPYYDYMRSNGVIPLDYVLFRRCRPTRRLWTQTPCCTTPTCSTRWWTQPTSPWRRPTSPTRPVMVTETGGRTQGDPS
ncbi:unnamed protein product [Miscanthus lutarioriparius]|uniref:Glucan endo-1,3-beta-D-glucosidase n=1 Tax=Miscanthus lutarioriparius TaxID=422564 RepID=A0A811N2X3_9POAL|nr:unnamed protein product [Miscanthus lutarioriparius]